MNKGIKVFLITIVILLIMFAIGLTIFVVLSKDDNDSNDTSISDEYITKIFDKEWVMSNMTIYQNEEIITDVKMVSFGYFKFNESQLEYCTYEGNECIRSDYTYKENVINILNSGRLEEGKYILNIEDDMFTLSIEKEEENKKIVYSFGVPTG